MSTAMNDADTVLYEVRDGIATVKINRPEIRNALSPAAANRLFGPADAVLAWGAIAPLLLSHGSVVLPEPLRAGPVFAVAE